MQPFSKIGPPFPCGVHTYVDDKIYKSSATTVLFLIRTMGSPRRNKYTCPTCQKETTFVFGRCGPRGIKWGCDQCKHGFRMAQIAEGRRRRNTSIGRLTPRDCQSCGGSYRPTEGRRNTVNCPPCIFKLKLASSTKRICLERGCEVGMDPRRKFRRCDEHAAERSELLLQSKLARGKRIRASITASQRTTCIVCAGIFDWRITLRRHKNGHVDICPVCYNLDNIRADLGVPLRYNATELQIEK